MLACEQQLWPVEVYQVVFECWGRLADGWINETADDFELYLKRIRHIPIEELARRFDYKTKIAVEELVSLSSFMKRALLYLGAVATISIYLNILTRR